MMAVGRFWVDKTNMLQLPRTEDPQGEQVRRARLFVASRAVGVEDCAELLGMLGLGFTVGEVAERRAAIDQEQAANTVIQADEERT